MTLSYWLRDYVYVRMGGRDDYVRNILIVFALVGLWHGAGWNFVAWGIYHGLLVIVYHFTAPAWDRLPRPIAIAFTFVLVSFGWPLFFLSLDTVRSVSRAYRDGSMGRLGFCVSITCCFSPSSVSSPSVCASGTGSTMSR